MISNRHSQPHLFILFFYVFLPLPLQSATVHVRLIDGESSGITPAMICITGAGGEVRLPPDGRILGKPSSTRDFYSGVEYDSDPNWIGPVRKMRGIGDNDDRSYVYEELLSVPYWEEPVMYQTSGDFTIELPVGTWRIAADRGMEFIPVVEEFRVGRESTAGIELILKRWIDLPAKGWWSGDVHVHHPTLLESHRQFLLSYARACDLHLVNVLEMGHHEGTDFHQKGFGRNHRVQDEDYWLVSGQEEPRSQFGHIIGLNMSSLARDLETYDFYDLAFNRIHDQQNTLVGFAHFSWNGCALPRGFPWYVTTEALDFIELLQFSKINTLDYYDYLNLGFRLTAAAGSDVPWGSSMGEVKTFVHTGPKLDVDAWFRNLKKGHSFVSNGPVLEFTVDNALPGSELVRKAGDKVRIRAKVLSHPAIGIPKALTLAGNDGVIMEITNPDKHSSLTIDLDRTIAQSQWLVLSTVCDNNALAHTTPVYIKVDDRPTWCPDRGPAIITKQLESIASLTKEFSLSHDAHARGVRQRLHRARGYYQQLLREMTAYSDSKK